MERDVYEVLERWAAAERRLPLVLCGARQVGKTYALQELGRRSFSSCAYLNFMDEGAQAVLEGGYDARRALDNIGIYTHTKIIPGQTLVVLDEVQEAPAVLPLMKAFAEDAPEYHVAAAGSYLGIAYHAGESFPVGKVQMVDMHPACFLEFLGAVGEGELARLVRSQDFGRLAPFEDRLRRLLREYLYVGGMPQAIVAFMDGDRDYQAARAIQSALLQQYDRDFSKHPAPHEVERIRLAFDSIPAHLGRENHKFVFGHIARGARAREYETAIQWIVDSGLATRVYRVDKLAKPLKFYRDLSAFKLFLPDVGLLGAAMEVDASDVILSNAALEEYKGALTEQYVCQQLVACGITPYYWTSGATAELDFVVSRREGVVPIEVKAKENLRARSLRLVHERYGLHGVRTSMSGYREQDWMTNVPLWAIGACFLSEETDKSGGVGSFPTTTPRYHPPAPPEVPRTTSGST